jgi:hypothetical protein
LNVTSISSPLRSAISCTVVDATGELRDGIEVREAHALDFVGFQSVRKIPSYKGQAGLPGLYWFGALDRLIPYESRLEMLSLMLLDFDVECLDVLPQPLALHFHLGDGSAPWHVPDFLVSLPGGRFLLVDVKPRVQAEKLKNQATFSMTKVWCERLGWEYRVFSEPDEIYQRNLRWLAGFRRHPVAFDAYADELLDAVGGEARSVGSLLAGFDAPALVRPVLFHLLWRQVLQVEMYAPLEDSSTVVLSTRRLAA